MHMHMHTAWTFDYSAFAKRSVKIFVSNVEDAIRIRTGETGIDAI